MIPAGMESDLDARKRYAEREMEVYDSFPPEMREQIARWGCDELHNLPRIMRNLGITPEMFCERHRCVARSSGMMGKTSELLPIRRKRVR